MPSECVRNKTVARPTVFLDRDGTLNVDKGYVHRIEDWEWIPGAINALVALRQAGFLVIVVTNQAGIARGYYREDEAHNLHGKINQQLQQYGGWIDGFYHCPHHPEFGAACECRKPKPGLIHLACSDFSIDLSRSWLVGDKVSDIQAGCAVGLKSILVLTGYGHNEYTQLGDDGIYFPDVGSATRYIISLP